MCVEDPLVNVGPELFPEEVKAVDEVAGEPLLPDLSPGLILLWVIDCGEAGCGTGADDFREVERFVSVVLSRNEDPCDGIEGAFAEAAVAKGVKAIVLVEEDGTQATD